MRIIDWSSDVFSSDLRIDRIRHGNIILYDPVWISTQQDRQGIALAGSLLAKPRKLGLGGSELGLGLPPGQLVNVAPFEQHGRASCRERGGQNVLNLVAAVTQKKTEQKRKTKSI